MKLVFLHGLGATSGVWSPLLDVLDWPDETICIDLPGHGSAPWTGDYTVEAMATAVGQEIASQGDEPVFVVGHSLGGGVALALGSQAFGCNVSGVLGLGIKTNWLDAEVEALAGVAAKGVRWFETESDALGRFVRSTGLDPRAASDVALCRDAVAFEDGSGWRLAQDPASFAQRPLDMAGLIDGATCPAVLGAGADDAMVPERDIRPFFAHPKIADGAGHNVQVDRPGWVADLVRESVARAA